MAVFQKLTVPTQMLICIHCPLWSDEDADSSENELQSILPEIEVTSKEEDFVLVKFESTNQGASSSRATAPMYYTGCTLVVHGKKYEIKFLLRTKGELFVYLKIDDIVRI